MERRLPALSSMGSMTTRRRASNDNANHRRIESADESLAATRRAFWSGSISFGLLQIPVTLHTAEQTKDLRFHQLDRKDHAPIHYERVSGASGKRVEWKDIVRGYEIAPGQFVVVDDEDLEAANVKATQTIDLEDFVDLDEVSPLFFRTPYYVAPGKRAAKAYALFRDALAKKGVAAIASVVIRTRQHLCALFARGDVLVLELLRFAYELRPPTGLGVPHVAPPEKGKAEARELAMAEELIESMRGPFDPAKYKDTFHDRLLAAIEEKARTGKVTAPRERETPQPTVVDLLSVLKKSLEARKTPGAKASPEPDTKKARRSKRAKKGPRTAAA
jgi:DNA end-binding protein Ku